MTGFINKLTQKPFFQKFEKTFPCTKKLRKRLGNPKVKKVAWEVFKCLGAIALGAAFGALTFMPSGLPLVIAGTVTGGVAAGIAYFATAGVIAVIKKYGFPASKYRTEKPLPTEHWLDDENHDIFKEVLKEKIQTQPWFQTWRNKHKFKSEAAMEHYLWRRFQKGACLGEAQAMMLTLAKNDKLTTKELYKKLKAEDVFHRQLLEIIRAEIPTNDIDPLLNNIPGYHTHTPHEMKNLNEFKTILKDYIQNQKCTAATLRLEGKEKAHSIFLQFSPTLRFYDGIDNRYTGFHENFKSVDEFVDVLYQHVKGYHLKMRPSRLPFQQVKLRGYSLQKSN